MLIKKGISFLKKAIYLHEFTNINIMRMKNFTILFVLALVVLNCKKPSESDMKDQEGKSEITYVSFGEKIIPDDAIAAKSMAQHYTKMQVGDSINSKMRGKVNTVCQAKGCWMKVDLENGEEVMVKFKDYGFFMPKNIAGKEVIINGKAYVNEIQVSELQHYAEDAGKTKDEIAAITKPEKTYSFEADGVLLVENN